MLCIYLHTKSTLYLKMQEETKSYCKKKQRTQIKSTEMKYNHRAIRLRFASNSSRGGAGVGAMDTGNASLGSSVGRSKKIFFGNSKKCRLEILANGLKIEKKIDLSHLPPTIGWLPPKNWSRG